MTYYEHRRVLAGLRQYTQPPPRTLSQPLISLGLKVHPLRRGHAVQTVFGSLKHYEKGGVQAIHADPRHYVFSNIFEVASKSKAYEKVAVAQNVKYVIEALRAEGASPWFAADHDEGANRHGWRAGLP